MSAGRATRLLDAAGELLLTFGYRKVTIEDVARRAGVGKGTVYLHWASKLELFATVLVRDSVEVNRALLAALHTDPTEVLLHRTLRTSYVEVMGRPLTRAFFRGDTDLLGAVATDSKIGTRVVADKTEFLPGYLTVLHQHGLLTDDPATDAGLAYRLSAATVGFFLPARLVPGAEADLGARADALATVVRRGFEPDPAPGPAAIRAAAAVVAELHQQRLTELTRVLPEEQP